MKRGFNWMVWAGFAVALLATFSYIPLFTRFPSTRDFPWVNGLLYAAAVVLLATGLVRAFGPSAAYRGKIAGSILGVLSLAMMGLFGAGVYMAGKLPSPETAARVGQRAPDFRLTATDGTPVTLAGLRTSHQAVLLIFYRGYW